MPHRHHHHSKSTAHRDQRHLKPSHEDIARLAYWIYEACGREDGGDKYDWNIAKSLLEFMPLSEMDLTLPPCLH